MFDRSKYKIDLKKIYAKDIMTEVVVTLPEDTLVQQAAHLMLRDRINGVPVIDENKRVVGILTLADLFKMIDRAANKHHFDFFEELFKDKGIKISEIMTRNILTILPETPLDEIVKFTVEMKIHTFPVIKGGNLVGIVGKHDILNAVFSFT